MSDVDELIKVLRSVPGCTSPELAAQMVFGSPWGQRVQALEAERDAAEAARAQAVLECERLADERDRLREALLLIRTEYGTVCGAFDLCSPNDCVAPTCQPWDANRGSYSAWATADVALDGKEVT